MCANFKFGNIEIFIQKQEEMRQYRERLKYYDIENTKNGFIVNITDPEVEQELKAFLEECF